MAEAPSSRGIVLKLLVAVVLVACAWYTQRNQGASPQPNVAGAASPTGAATSDAPTKAPPAKAPAVERGATPGAEKLAQANKPSASPAPSKEQKPAAKPGKPDDGGAAKVKKLFETGTSNTVVDVYGKVDRILADDNEGSKHQKFILKLRDGHTVLVAHNIDLTDRVPIKVGDEVHLKGEFEYDERGGVIHWTHRDPQRRHEAGFIEHLGKRYQ